MTACFAKITEGKYLNMMHKAYSEVDKHIMFT